MCVSCAGLLATLSKSDGAFLPSHLPQDTEAFQDLRRVLCLPRGLLPTGRALKRLTNEASETSEVQAESSSPLRKHILDSCVCDHISFSHVPLLVTTGEGLSR